MRNFQWNDNRRRNVAWQEKKIWSRNCININNEPKIVYRIKTHSAN